MKQLMSNRIFLRYQFNISNQNVEMESGNHRFLHLNCQHQMACVKFNLKIHYPSPYERESSLPESCFNHIRNAVKNVSQKNAFRDLNVNYMVFVFNKTVKNIPCNFILHETFICDDIETSKVKQVKENSLTSNYNKRCGANKLYVRNRKDF